MMAIKKSLGVKFSRPIPKRQQKNMIILSNWTLKCNGLEDGIPCYRVLTDEEIPCPCPDCFGKLIKKGWRTRFLTRTKHGAAEDDYEPYEKICLLIRRMQCKECGTVHHALPDIIVPYKRLSIDIIEGIIRQPEKPSLIAYETAINLLKWWRFMKAYIARVAPSIKEKHDYAITHEKNLREIVRALAHSHLWPGTRSKLRGT